jgi:hypothetical protein
MSNATKNMHMVHIWFLITPCFKWCFLKNYTNQRPILKVAHCVNNFNPQMIGYLFCLNILQGLSTRVDFYNWTFHFIPKCMKLCELSNNAMSFLETSNACKIIVSLHYHFFKHFILKLVSFSIMDMKTWNLSRTSNMVLRKQIIVHLDKSSMNKQNILHHLWTRFAFIHKCQNAQDLEVCVFHFWLEINIFIVFLLDNFDTKVYQLLHW